MHLSFIRLPLIFSAGLIILAAGCSSSLDKDEFVSWVQDYENGLRVRTEHDQYVFDLQFQPAPYVWLQRGGSASTEELKSTQYYNLTIAVKGGTTDFISASVSSHVEKQQKLYYFSYLFQEDIHLEENGRTLPCVLYHFEKGIGRESTFVLGFETSGAPSTEAKLVVACEQFGSFPITMKISKDKIPSLKAYDESYL